jgi:hypothetical protein
MTYREVVAEGNRLPRLARGRREMPEKAQHSSRLRVMRVTFKEQLPAPPGLKK